MNGLAGRSVVVTGASRGIGLAVSAAVVDAGARVFMLARSADVLHRAASALGDQAVALPCDITQASDMDAVHEQIQQASGGAPDVLVNNAGLFPLASIENTSPETFADTLHLNLLAPFVAVRTFLGAMRARGSGHVVTIGSVADRNAFPENGAYSATKYGQRAFHEVLRQEVRGSGVRASLVSPGPTDTNIWDQVDPDNRDGFPPRAMMLRPEDVADAVLWAITRPAHVNVDELRLNRS